MLGRRCRGLCRQRLGNSGYGEEMHKRTGVSLLLVMGALVVSACSGAASQSTETLSSTTLAATPAAVDTQTCDIVGILDRWSNKWYSYTDALHIRDISDATEKDKAFLEWRNSLSYLLGPHVLKLDQIVEQAAAADVAGETDATAVLEYVVVVRNMATMYLAVDSLQQLDSEAFDDVAEFRRYVVVRERCAAAGQASAPATTTAPSTLTQGEQDYLEAVRTESGYALAGDDAVFMLTQGYVVCDSMRGWAESGGTVTDWLDGYLTTLQQLVEEVRTERSEADSERFRVTSLAMAASVPFDLCPELAGWANDR